MNLKTWGPIALALVLGLIAAKLGRDMLAQRPAPKGPDVRFTHVVVAKDGVAAGSKLAAENLTVTQFPENGVPAGAFRSIEEAIGRVVTAQVIKGQPVSESVLAPVGSASGLTAMVPDGMRAVTVEVNETSGVAGLLAVGCRVDIVTTLTGDQALPAVAKTVARNLLILAVGRRYGTGGATPDVEAPPARSVTLLATPKEAEVVELACRLGVPRLVLRGTRESHDPESDGTTLAELRGTAAAGGFRGLLASLLTPTTRPAATPTAVAMAAGAAPATQPAAEAATKLYRDVQMIKGTSSQTVRVEIEKPRQFKEAVVDVRSDLEGVSGGK